MRQLLVARPGQKPCAWLDFETVRGDLMSWLGYGIIGVARRQVGSVPTAGNKPTQGCLCAGPPVQHRAFAVCHVQ